MRVALPSIKFDIQLNWWLSLVFVLWCLFPTFMEFMLHLVTSLWFVLLSSQCFLLHVNIVSMFIVRCHCAVFCKHLSTGTFVLHLLVAFAYIFVFYKLFTTCCCLLTLALVSFHELSCALHVVWPSEAAGRTGPRKWRGSQSSCVMVCSACQYARHLLLSCIFSLNKHCQWLLFWFHWFNEVFMILRCPRQSGSV